MGIYRAIRALKRRLTETDELSGEEARDLFFAACVHGFLSHLQSTSDFTSSEPRDIFGHSELVVGFVTRAAPLMPRYAAVLSEMLPSLVEAIRRDPLILGWAYQIWNEEERARSTWAVSRREETQSDLISIAAATQLFTEAYMTQFLLERAFAGESPEAWELFDPACGVGHFLVEAVRNLYARTGSPEAVVDFVSGRLFGVDIDPGAVELCRVLVWFESIRYSPESAERTWVALQSAIRSLSSEFGTLDRRSSEPLLNRYYRCVATNPPYLGRRKLTKRFRAFLDQHYPDSSVDLCAAFLERCVELVAPSGSLAVVTVDKWLRLGSYAALRAGGRSFAGLYNTLTIDTLCELGERAFRRELGLHDGVRILLTVGRREPPPREHRIMVLDATGCGDPLHKASALREFAEQGISALVRTLPQQQLRDGNGAEVLYRSKLPGCLQRSGQHVKDLADIVVGLQTNDDRRLVRFHWEVIPDAERWRVHNKGGGYGRWFGLNRYVLDWATGRSEFERNARCGIRVQSYFERVGWTYTWFANGCLGLRRKECGWSFGRAAAAGLFCDDDRIVAFLNSRFGSLCARTIGGKIQLPEGIVRKLPLPAHLDSIDPRLVSAAVSIKRALVSRDPTDVSFRPDLCMKPQVCVALEALLLLVEDELEQQVERCLGCGASEMNELTATIGLPVARMGYRGRGREAMAHLWGLIPEDLQWIEELVRAPYGVREPVQVDEDRVLLALGRGSSGREGRAFLPSDTRLEGVCRRTALHPLEACHVILEKCASDVRFYHAVFLPYIADEILIGVADALGHRWWSAGSHTRRFECRGVVSIDVAEQHVHRHLVERFGSMCPFSYEEALGCSLRTWLEGRFLTWQASRFFRKPFVVGVGQSQRRLRGFKHVWDEKHESEMNIPATELLSAQ